jgi:hypothetical protein
MENVFFMDVSPPFKDFLKLRVTVTLNIRMT